MVDLLLIRKSLKPLTCLTFADSSWVSVKYIGKPMARERQTGSSSGFASEFDRDFLASLDICLVNVFGLLIRSEQVWLTVSVNLLAVCLRRELGENIHAGCRYSAY